MTIRTLGNLPITCYQNKKMYFDNIFFNGELKPGLIIAANPEKVIKCKYNSTLRNIISNSTMFYPDGIGISLALYRKFLVKVTRMPGCELWLLIAENALKNNKTIFICGGTKHVNNETTNILINDYGCSDKIFNTCGYQSDESLIKKISSSKAKVIFLGLGSPRQELLASQIFSIDNSLTIVCVGGSFDVFTKTIKRAPVLFQKIGMEWLWRLMLEPSRIIRQVVLIQFLYKYVIFKD